MGFVDTLFRYFTDEKVPLSRKFKLVIFGVIVVILIDNHYGVSHTVINSYKVSYMMKLESAKLLYNMDPNFVEEIDRLIETEHNRKGVVEKFYSILTPNVDESQKNNKETAFNKIIEERDPMTHTLTGAFITLLPMLSGFIVMLITLFNPKHRSFDKFFWGFIMILGSATVTYYISLAWALLNPICGHVWINYIIQAVINILILILAVGHLETYGHKLDDEAKMQSSESKLTKYTHKKTLE